MMEAIFEFLDLNPLHLRALAFGVLLSLGISQILKKTFNLDKFAYVMPGIAFFLASFSTFTTWPPVGLSVEKWGGIWAGIIVGIFTPWLFKSFKDYAKLKEWAIARYL